MNKKDHKNEYQTILNNLLDISPNDPAVFTKTDNNFCLDLYKHFDEEVYNKVLYSKENNVPLIEKFTSFMIEKTISITDPIELINYLTETNFELSDSRKIQIQKHFDNQKNRIISELKARNQKNITFYKIFDKKVEEIFEQTSTWPLYVGFIFVKVNIDNKAIFAPLFYKKVSFEFKNGRTFLSLSPDIVLNEKLIFIIKQNNFDLNFSEDLLDLAPVEIIENLNNSWKDLYDFKVEKITSCPRFNAEEIRNSNLEFYGGFVLCLCQPTGGYARNRMLEIINDNEIDKIIDVEFDKKIYDEKIDKIMFDTNKSIFKITPTNYSQDRAIISALSQNTIIWGPPGTGKSQTIVNILTNILFYGKTSLVCSEKKAALDVISDRLGILNQYALELNISKFKNRNDFYKPIKKYWKFLQYFNFSNKDRINPEKIDKLISNDEINFISYLNKNKNDKFDQYLYFIAKLGDAIDDLKKEEFITLINLDKEIKYPTIKVENKNYKKELLKKNNLKFFHFFNKKWKYINKNHQNIFNHLGWLNTNLNELLNASSSFDKNDLTKIKELKSMLPKYIHKDLIDIKKINSYIATNITEKIKKLIEKNKTMVNNFSVVINTAKMEPYKFIKKFIEIIKTIYPIIIATPNSDLSAWNKDEFDYAILDESSQMFFEKGLPMLYLGKRKILAGDDQQMRPSNWFGFRSVDNDEILGNIESVLDYAKGYEVHEILLDKNYRSNYAALMTFSSKHFYDESLDVIDLFHLNEKNNKPIEIYDVEGEWINNTNIKENEFAISKLKENINSYNKIILLCFNKKQKEKIQEDIMNNHKELEEAIMTNKLLIRNIENIQGDEADLVIATVAYDKNAAIHSTYVGRSGGKNALNVAISRAKEKLIVIKSIKANEIILNENTGEDIIIFKKWLEFLELSDEERKNYIQKKEEINNNKLNNLKKNIFDELANEIGKYNNLELKDNEKIGTIDIDFAIKNGPTLEIGFIINDYSFKNVKDYLKFHDKIKFIKSKNYRIYALDRIQWEKDKYEIFDFISHLSLEIDEYKKDQTTEIIYQQKASKIYEIKALESREETISAFDNKKEIDTINSLTLENSKNELSNIYLEKENDLVVESKENFNKKDWMEDTYEYNENNSSDDEIEITINK
ncbi:ATP-binding protein [Mycoplasmopsis meleagridis]|uniref:ATP-binding protein n=1 Tax=Mycoplasmopsis meleagridis ATCC 25294 TaxID=1264554 RepID=A0A0F5H1X0_9BACT|nr:AAA domain-containing protein [Mycoplasmopsis meleagridis]KKB26832.1 ATP-binding protein [Mycoplasmopsis meleagridis ATCC 25294]OAD18387.1 ATP-binding protein [Mycoplasmopsis meleagridis]VEU77429.1 putative DNA helicase [Mycoplasmopsis meleagridis]